MCGCFWENWNNFRVKSINILVQNKKLESCLITMHRWLDLWFNIEIEKLGSSSYKLTWKEPSMLLTPVPLDQQIKEYISGRNWFILPFSAIVLYIITLIVPFFDQHGGAYIGCRQTEGFQVIWHTIQPVSFQCMSLSWHMIFYILGLLSLIAITFAHYFNKYYFLANIVAFLLLFLPFVEMFLILISVITFTWSYGFSIQIGFVTYFIALLLTIVHIKNVWNTKITDKSLQES